MACHAALTTTPGARGASGMRRRRELPRDQDAEGRLAYFGECMSLAEIMGALVCRQSPRRGARPGHVRRDARRETQLFAAILRPRTRPATLGGPGTLTIGREIISQKIVLKIEKRLTEGRASHMGDVALPLALSLAWDLHGAQPRGPLARIGSLGGRQTRRGRVPDAERGFVSVECGDLKGRL